MGAARRLNMRRVMCLIIVCVLATAFAFAEDGVVEDVN